MSKVCGVGLIDDAKQGTKSKSKWKDRIEGRKKVSLCNAAGCCHRSWFIYIVSTTHIVLRYLSASYPPTTAHVPTKYLQI